MWRTLGRLCIIKARAKAEVASASSCAVSGRMFRDHPDDGFVSFHRLVDGIRAGPTGSPNRSTASIMPEVPVYCERAHLAQAAR